MKLDQLSEIRITKDREMKFLLIFPMCICAAAEYLQDVDYDDYTIHFPHSMFEMCPYFVDCNFTSTYELNVTDGFEPCCKQCSCKSDCGITRNCCREEFDKSVGILNEECTLPAVLFSKTSPKSSLHYIMNHYLMVQECPVDGYSKSCYEFAAATWGAMYPVTSPSKGYTFINQECAKCNGVNDGVPWDVSVMCSAHSEAAGDSTVIEKIKGTLTKENDCSIFFHPKGYIAAMPFVCHPDIIRRCNVFGYFSNVSEEIEDLCKSFNATFSHSNIFFGNVYCFQCNIKVRNVRYECPSDHDDKKDIFLENTFVSLMKYDHLESVFQPNSDANGNNIGSRESVCGFLDDEKDECRPVLCPEGQIWLATKGCSIFSQSWFSESFNLFIKLTYVHAAEMVRISCFSTQYQNQENTSFLKLHVPGLLRWKKIVYFHPTFEGARVEYFVVKLTLLEEQMSPDDDINAVAKTLDKVWTIITCNQRYHFYPHFNEFLKYKDRTTVYLPNQIFGVMAYVPYYLHNGHSLDASMTEILIAISMKDMRERISIVKGMVLTESFFCQLTYLRDEEYVDYTDRLFIKKLGIFLENGQYERVRNNDIFGIKVCVNVEDRYTSKAEDILTSNRSWLTLFCFVSVIILQKQL